MKPWVPYAVIACVCVCATVLCALGQLPSQAATAILGGAIVQVTQLAVGKRAKKSDPPPSKPPTLPPVGPVVGMLAGAGLPALVVGL